MSEHSEENEELSVPPQSDTDVVSLIKKMQQQLNYLEKKIDLLIGGQSPERPFRDREKRFSKPFRPSFGGGSGGRDFNRGPRREGGFSSGRSREGGFSSDRPRPSGFSSDRPRPGGFSKDRPREGGFSSDRPRERSSSPERSFDRKPSAGPRGFGHGDKPFFRHRKGPR